MISKAITSILAVSTATLAYLLWKSKKKEHKVAPRRFGGAIRLTDYTKYRELHDRVWPAVQKRMFDSNIRNFTIFYHAETKILFQCFEWIGHWKYYEHYGRYPENESEVFAQDMKAITQDPITRQWWSQCEPCQEPFAQWNQGSPLLSQGGSGDWWDAMECVCHTGNWPLSYSLQTEDPDFVKMGAASL